MKVILLKDVARVGRKHDIKDVSDGYAINSLIPQKAAIAATPEAIKKVETEKSKAEGERQVREDLILKNLETLGGATLPIAGRANDNGHLFAGLHREEIAAEISRQMRIQLDPGSIMIDHPIKETGEHMIELRGAGKTVTMKVVIS